jgi:DNA repair exonuclease SbcCD nuclease subunit
VSSQLQIADTLGFALEAFQVSGCPPVFIAPGNHDPSFPRSLCWNDALLAARGRQWPAHVRVFTSESWTSAELPELERVRIWGRCFVSQAVSAERPLAASATSSITPGDGSRVELALFHGSREGTCPYGMDLTAPFSDAEALASPFTYLAVGHYHTQALLSAQQGPAAGVRLGYAGSPVALNMSEIGSHGGLDVRIEFGRRQPYIEVEPVGLDPRRVHAIPVDVTRCGSAEQVDRRIEKALDDAGVSAEDLVCVQLTGRLAKDVRYQPAPRLKERVFHLEVNAKQMRRDYDVESVRGREPTTTEDRFVRALLERMDNEPDPARKAAIERALYYGLDAFTLGEVVPAHEISNEAAAARHQRFRRPARLLPLRSSRVTCHRDDNERGKSTMQSAITAALYGLIDDRRSHRLLTPHERWRPWGGNSYDVEIEVESEGNRYTVSRNFDASTVDIRDGAGRDVAAEFREGKDEYPVGRKLLDLDADEFERCSFVRQGDLFQVVPADEKERREATLRGRLEAAAGFRWATTAHRRAARHRGRAPPLHLPRAGVHRHRRQCDPAPHRQGGAARDRAEDARARLRTDRAPARRAGRAQRA